jgi:hypothetical protein
MTIKRTLMDQLATEMMPESRITLGGTRWWSYSCAYGVLEFMIPVITLDTRELRFL